MRSLKIRRSVGQALLFILLAAISLSTLYPVAFTVNTAFKSQDGWLQSTFTPAFPPSLENFKEVWRRSDVPRGFLNSLVTTGGGVVGAWLVCSLAAYAATKMRFRGRDVIFQMLLAAMMIPLQTILYSFFVLMGNLKLTNTYHGLALAFTVFSIPMTTYQLAAYFKGIPNELIDAAKIDGATGLQTIFRIILPIARPALITIGLINFVWTWNDLLLPLIMMQDMDMFPLILSLALLKGRYGAPPPLIAAGVVIGIAPVAIAYLLAQEHIVKGMTLGAIKS